MTNEEKKQDLLILINKVHPDMPEAELEAILSELISKVGRIRYRLRDMPLITGALNLLISSIVLDYEEKERNTYEDDTALKTLVDLALL
jgi:hypothetical protein